MVWAQSLSRCRPTIGATSRVEHYTGRWFEGGLARSLSVVAGVGNIYADESLFEARLPPWQIAATASRSEADRLRRAVAKVLGRAIEGRGSSIRNYVGGTGLQGSYQREFRVYGCNGRPL